MSGPKGFLARLSARDSSAGSVGAVLVTGGAIVAVALALGVVATTVYDVLPRRLAFPGLVVTIAVLGVGGLYATLRVRDWLG